MSAVPSKRAADSARRLHRLAAMGLRAWRLRSRDGGGAGQVGAASPRCLLLVAPPALLDARQRALLDAVAAVLALPTAALRAVAVTVGQAMGEANAAPAWLVFGIEQKRTLGPALDAAVARGTRVAVVDTPADLLATPALKADLWQALKTLRRALRES